MNDQDIEKLALTEARCQNAEKVYLGLKEDTKLAKEEFEQAVAELRHGLQQLTDPTALPLFDPGADHAVTA